MWCSWLVEDVLHTYIRSCVYSLNSYVQSLSTTPTWLWEYREAKPLSACYLDKNDNFACHVTFAGWNSAIFEKRTQKEQTWNTHPKVANWKYALWWKDAPIICYTAVTESLTTAQVMLYNSCNFCWLNVVQFSKNAPKSSKLEKCTQK